ncbi:response regulator [Leifsonia aquatica]|uniref:response regulator transcription factor n=1 Tax=Leifsonia aquatica TaxID=144185 RepID=UPI00384EE948
MTRILIVDDDALVRAGLTMILQTADDLEVVGEATDGAGAIRQTKLHQPDIVLMDLRMSGMDGRTATEELMKLADPPKVLVLTTFDTDEHVIAALDAGASGYLLKDTPPVEIIDAVRETVDGCTILSPRHTRVLLEKYSENGSNAERNRAKKSLALLTERERQVVRYVAEGLTNSEIAGRLHCSPATVKAHLANIFSQLQITNRVRLAIIGNDAGLVDRS